MKENIKKRIEEMYKNINNRPVELVFYDKKLKKSIRELDDEVKEKKEQ